MQASKLQNIKTNASHGSAPELRRTSSFDRTWEETVAESVANELVLQVHSSSGSLGSLEQQDETSKSKLKESKPVKPGRLSHEEKKVGKLQEEKRTRPRKMREFHNIKISQVGLVLLKHCSTLVLYCDVLAFVSTCTLLWCRLSY